MVIHINSLDSILQIHQTLVIIVEDINDNEPVFKAYKTSHILPEGARPQLVDTLEATDRDQGPFGQVVYQFQVFCFR